MTEPDQAVIARLSSDFAAMAAYLARASTDLRRLERIVAERPVTAAPVAPAAPAWQPAPQPKTPRSDGWIGKVLAVAGVTVTLVGVALLLVLAAQAGILSPGLRVFAGATLAAGLLVVAARLVDRPGGRVGAIALAATGVAAAYLDVIAVTTIYHWLPAAAGLAVATVVAVSGLMLARRWNSERLGLLVLVPLMGVGPVVADGMTVLVGFMLTLGAASIPVQLGRDWIGMHAARTAVITVPLSFALVVTSFDSGRSPMLGLASVVAAALALGGAVVLLPDTSRGTAVALSSAVGTAPVLAASAALDSAVAAALAAALSGTLLALVLTGERLGHGTRVRTVWAALAAVSALVAVAVAFDGPVAGPVLVAMTAVLAVGGRRHEVAHWCSVGLGAAGGLFYLAYAPPSSLVEATAPATPIAASILVTSLLLVVWAVVAAWSRATDWSRATAAVVASYAITTFTVTLGVLIGGADEGFLAGQVAATLCWIVVAAAVLRHAVGVSRDQRSLAVGGGMALVAAAVAKLFLFDLGTLSGIFRVVVFIAVGLALLAMGSGYARLLAQRDGGEPQN